MENNTIKSVGLAAVILVGAFLLRPVITVTPQLPQIIVQSPTSESPLGAIPGSRIETQDFTVNGVERRFFSSALNQASTTLCSFKTPSATSTLQIGSAKITTGTTTAIAVEIGKSVSLAATTTKLAYAVLASNAQVTLVATSTTNGGADDPSVFAPNNWFNVKYGGAAGSLNTLVGSCKAIFLIN